jgi:glutamine synthetase
MLGSAASVSGSNTVLNTAVAEELKQFADKLEGVQDFNAALHDLIQTVIKEHKRIIFNGNGYDDSWIAEAEKRGLSNLKTTPDALAHWLDEKNVALFTEHKVFSEAEMNSREEIMFEAYEKLIKIEAKTAVDMAYHDLLPSISNYISYLKANDNSAYETELASELSDLLDKAFHALKDLNSAIEKADAAAESKACAFVCKDEVIPAMSELRKYIDKAETLTAADYWAVPTYGELLFDVR